MEEKDRWGFNWDVWIKAKFRCAYCGFDGLSSILAAHQLTVDHIRPRCRDGRDNEENLTAACCCCNAIKAEWDRSVYEPTEFENRPAADVFARAKTYVDEWYQKWNPGYLKMIDEAGLGTK